MVYLISGGSGFLGKEITNHLLSLGNEVRWLSRNTNKSYKNVSIYYWDPTLHKIDDKAFIEVDIIVHLAGDSILKRWTKSNKHKILNSRVKTTNFLVDYLLKNDTSVKTFISTSAIGYYGNTKDHVITENSANGTDFLGLVCKNWELPIEKLQTKNIRSGIMRLGFVISNNGGAFPLFTKSIKLFGGVVLGNGNQWMSWIHANDIAQFISWFSENNKLNGTFNLVSPHPIHHDHFVKVVSGELKRWVWPLKVPAFIIKLFVGKSASILLNSNRVIPKNLQESGFIWKFDGLKEVLKSNT